MAGVRIINKERQRYLVTHSHTQIMDNCRMSVVEQRFDVFDSLHYFWCMKHKSAGCECVQEVKRVRDDAGLTDNRESF